MSVPMEVGDVRIAEDADFQKVKDMCLCHDSWKQEYNKHGTTVWTKSNDVSDFKLVKVRGILKDVSAATMYDVLHDPVYRKIWDFNMLEGFEMCCLNPNNDISYYALKAPKPFKNRDFVTQRSWLDLGKEFLIINHSVNHASLPPKKAFVRGISYLTGYLIVSNADRPTDPGCTLSYVTQSDPKGKLPVWAVNKMTHWFAPKVMKTLYKAAKTYDSWKAKHNPNLKPWLYPEQMDMPRINLSDIKSIQECFNSEVIDETECCEDELYQDEQLAV